jgi:hypothetical protein
MEEKEVWYKSVKVIVFLAVFGLIQISLIVLVALGKLAISTELVAAYLGAIVTITSSLFFSRAIASSKAAPKDCGCVNGLCGIEYEEEDEEEDEEDGPTSPASPSAKK